ncbi:MAG: glycogen synthase GlgA [Candidatus Omnitrophota bacterium]
MKIVMCASEMVPFAKTGGLADVVGALPLALEDLKQEIIVIIPKYKTINTQQFTITSIGEDVDVAKIGKNIKVYLIKSSKYFDRDALYGTKTGDYPDNLERFSFFCKRALTLLKEINFKPDIIHCHDWQTALVPVYLKSIYKNDNFYSKLKTIITVHNLGYQGLFSKDEFPKLGLDWSYFNIDGLEFYDKVNLLKGGLMFADLINTVSPTYAKEIQTKEFGCGLEGVLLKRKDSLFGLLNGIDYSIWDPAKDKFILKKYSLSSIKDKYVNKENLKKECGLAKKDVPLFGIVGRLAEQKGLDILAEIIDKICHLELQFVILGTGDLKYEKLLEEMAKKYPKVISYHIKFDDILAHKIYASSDIFVMPSKYEPCGLGQLISFKYGTIPLVFKTGGLADTVSSDNGFIFDEYSSKALLAIIKKALTKYRNKKTWSSLVKKAMELDFSWESAAEKYLELYTKVI